MNLDAALWLGITAGLILGAAGTWITTGIGIAIGRRIQHRADHLRAVIHEPSTDTFDNNLRNLIQQQKQKP